VADDEPAIRRALVVALTHGGYQVLEATDGEQALATVAAHHPELVLLDANMPKVHGFEVCRRLKADAQTQDITVFLLTASAQSDQRAEGLSAGADAYITKPFSPRQLLADIQAHFA
jgi:DNA-binding response OmpR family regulator